MTYAKKYYGGDSSKNRLKVETEQKTIPKNNYINSTIAGAILGLYAIGVTLDSNNLSRELDAQRSQLEMIAQNETPTKVLKFNEQTMSEQTAYDYGGKVDEIVDVVKQFAKENNAVYRGWGIVGEGKSVKTPAPVRLNPLNWNKEVDFTALTYK